MSIISVMNPINNKYEDVPIAYDETFIPEDNLVITTEIKKKGKVTTEIKRCLVGMAYNSVTNDDQPIYMWTVTRIP
jgi:hypothetical protein